ncbi:RYamide receptor-like [Penaeus indicus]|uniref:RYamide receptor-like n=1 Tax=Penaeus indicus TaxID=29960 RepID=UPI00300DA0F0
MNTDSNTTVLRNHWTNSGSVFQTGLNAFSLTRVRTHELLDRTRKARSGSTQEPGFRKDVDENPEQHNAGSEQNEEIPKENAKAITVQRINLILYWSPEDAIFLGDVVKQPSDIYLATSAKVQELALMEREGSRSRLHDSSSCSYTFMFHRWIFAPEFCRIVAFMQHVSVTCSVYTLVAIGVDRYKALIHPLNTRWTKSRARLVIGGIWLFSVVISLVPLIVSDSVRYDWDGEQSPGHHSPKLRFSPLAFPPPLPPPPRWYYECKENWPKTQDELYEKTYTVLLFIFTFVLPVVGLGYTYLSIVGMMCSYRMPGNAEPFRDQQQFLAKVKVINMMIAVMVCFVLSWFPLQVLQFLIYFAPDITQCRGRECFAYYMSFFTCHWIAMANSFMNPFIYCFMSKNFRVKVLHCVSQGIDKAGPQYTIVTKT